MLLPQVKAGFSENASTVKNNFNLIKAFLSRWRYATPLPLDVLRLHIAAPLDNKTGREAFPVLARRRFGLQLLATGPQLPFYVRLPEFLKWPMCSTCGQMSTTTRLPYGIAPFLTMAHI